MKTKGEIMETQIPEINRRHVIKTLSYTAVFNTVIAIFLTAVKFGGGPVDNFIVSQCIGISICSCMLTAHYFVKPTRLPVQLLVTIAGLIIGTVIGTLLGSVAVGVNPSIFFQGYSFFQIILIGILFGSIITYFFVSREKISASEVIIQEEKIKRLTSEKKVMESNLRLLQAQIEPHFLFNTLSNILSLIDTDTEKGKSMLEDLIHYLRTSLSKTRENESTIGQEMDMIEAYLNIFRVRMGERLRYRIDIPDTIKNILFPPMLLQPLVENAIKHGLEPRIEGGEVSIRGEKKGDTIRLEVADTGRGFHGDGDMGVGLSNIRERLRSLYCDKGRLILEENRPSGLKAIIEVPYARNQGDNSR